MGCCCATRKYTPIQSPDNIESDVGVEIPNIPIQRRNVQPLTVSSPNHLAIAIQPNERKEEESLLNHSSPPSASSSHPPIHVNYQSISPNPALQQRSKSDNVNEPPITTKVVISNDPPNNVPPPIVPIPPILKTLSTFNGLDNHSMNLSLGDEKEREMNSMTSIRAVQHPTIPMQSFMKSNLSSDRFSDQKEKEFTITPHGMRETEVIMGAANNDQAVMFQIPNEGDLTASSRPKPMSLPKMKAPTAQHVDPNPLDHRLGGNVSRDSHYDEESWNPQKPTSIMEMGYENEGNVSFNANVPFNTNFSSNANNHSIVSINEQRPGIALHHDPSPLLKNQRLNEENARYFGDSNAKRREPEQSTADQFILPVPQQIEPNHWVANGSASSSSSSMDSGQMASAIIQGLTRQHSNQSNASSRSYSSGDDEFESDSHSQSHSTPTRSGGDDEHHFGDINVVAPRSLLERQSTANSEYFDHSRNHRRQQMQLQNHSVRHEFEGNTPILAIENPADLSILSSFIITTFNALIEYFPYRHIMEQIYAFCNIDLQDPALRHCQFRFEWPNTDELDRKFNYFDIPDLFVERVSSTMLNQPALVLIIGAPGSGKTSYAHYRYGRSVTISADDYFDLQYNGEFVGEQLKEAHEYCRQRAFERLYRNQTVVVANTNSTWWHMYSYVVPVLFDNALPHKVVFAVMPERNATSLVRRCVHSVTKPKIIEHIRNIERMLSVSGGSISTEDILKYGNCKDPNIGNNVKNPRSESDTDRDSDTSYGSYGSYSSYRGRGRGSGRGSRRSRRNRRGRGREGRDRGANEPRDLSMDSCHSGYSANSRGNSCFEWGLYNTAEGLQTLQEWFQQKTNCNLLDDLGDGRISPIMQTPWGEFKRKFKRWTEIGVKEISKFNSESDPVIDLEVRITGYANHAMCQMVTIEILKRKLKRINKLSMKGTLWSMFREGVDIDTMGCVLAMKKGIPFENAKWLFDYNAIQYVRDGPIVDVKLATTRYVRNYIKYFSPPPPRKLNVRSNNVFFNLPGVRCSDSLLGKNTIDKSSFSLNVLEKHNSDVRNEEAADPSHPKSHTVSEVHDVQLRTTSVEEEEKKMLFTEDNDDDGGASGGAGLDTANNGRGSELSAMAQEFKMPTLNTNAPVFQPQSQTFIPPQFGQNGSIPTTNINGLPQTISGVSPNAVNSMQFGMSMPSNAMPSAMPQIQQSLSWHGQPSQTSPLEPQQAPSVQVPNVQKLLSHSQLQPLPEWNKPTPSGMREQRSKSATSWAPHDPRPSPSQLPITNPLTAPFQTFRNGAPSTFSSQRSKSMATLPSAALPMQPTILQNPNLQTPKQHTTHSVHKLEKQLPSTLNVSEPRRNPWTAISPPIASSISPQSTTNTSIASTATQQRHPVSPSYVSSDTSTTIRSMQSAVSSSALNGSNSVSSSSNAKSSNAPTPNMVHSPLNYKDWGAPPPRGRGSSRAKRGRGHGPSHGQRWSFQNYHRSPRHIRAAQEEEKRLQRSLSLQSTTPVAGADVNNSNDVRRHNFNPMTSQQHLEAQHQRNQRLRMEAAQQQRMYSQHSINPVASTQQNTSHSVLTGSTSTGRLNAGAVEFQMNRVPAQQEDNSRPIVAENVETWDVPLPQNVAAPQQPNESRENFGNEDGGLNPTASTFVPGNFNLSAAPIIRRQ